MYENHAQFTRPECGCTMCLGEGVKALFSYFFFFTCIRGTGRDLMGRLFCPIGVQCCIASRFSTTSQVRLISYQIPLLNYFPPTNGHPRPFSRIVSTSCQTNR